MSAMPSPLKYAIRRFAGSPVQWFGLENSSVFYEYVPLFTKFKPVNRIKRVEVERSAQPRPLLPYTRPAPPPPSMWRRGAAVSSPQAIAAPERALTPNRRSKRVGGPARPAHPKAADG
ncbi:MAG: hypothetical protein ACLTSX_12795 [Collinsella sp.]